MTESYHIANPKFYQEKNNELARRLSNVNYNNINKCIKQPEMNVVSKCTDNTMLRLDLDCLNSPVTTAHQYQTDHKANLNWYSQLLMKNSSEIKYKSISPIENGSISIRFLMYYQYQF